MNRYVAFLRAINVSGKNKIAMAELKQSFCDMGFENVATCLNSGNVAFSGEIEDKTAVGQRITAAISDRFGLQIPVFVIGQDELRDILGHAPNWWGSAGGELYDNLIFLMPPLTCAEFRGEIGALKDGYEMAQDYNNAIFWSFDRKNYQKTNWWPKTAQDGIRERITVRTANTAAKVAEL